VLTKIEACVLAAANVFSAAAFIGIDASSSPTSPSITLSVASGVPGTAITVSGAGFPRGEVVALYIDQPGPYLEAPGPIADANGSFTDSITWPHSNYDLSGKIDPTKAGSHLICGDTGYPGSRQPIAVKACAAFVENPLPSPTPSSDSGAKANAAAAASLPELIAGFAVLALLAFGFVVWLRRSS